MEREGGLYACVWGRERERETEADRQIDRQTDRDRGRQRDRDRQRQRDRREGGGRERGRLERERDRDRETERQRHRESCNLPSQNKTKPNKTNNNKTGLLPISSTRTRKLLRQSSTRHRSRDVPVRYPDFSEAGKTTMPRDEVFSEVPSSGCWP